MKTTIFYENSFGIISQWIGEILEKTENTIIIKFSPKTVLEFDLKKSDFLVICKKKIKPLNVLNSEYYKMYFESFDEYLRNQIIFEIEENNNLLDYWNGSHFLN